MRADLLTSSGTAGVVDHHNSDTGCRHFSDDLNDTVSATFPRCWNCVADLGDFEGDPPQRGLLRKLNATPISIPPSATS